MSFPTVDQDQRPVWFVNRMLVVLWPRQAFVEWVNAISGPDEGTRSLEELRAHASSFLIPIFDYPEEAWDWVEEHHLLLFETLLWQWTEDEGLWPGERDWEVFLAWFEPELMAAPWDVVSGPLSSDPPPPAGAEGWH